MAAHRITSYNVCYTKLLRNPEELFVEIEHQAKIGVDFMTLHCGVTRTSLAFLEGDKRVCGIVSRGGARNNFV